ncbi:MAG: hypothetical protein R3A10_12120 [Caldilineaceae bacterium]
MTKLLWKPCWIRPMRTAAPWWALTPSCVPWKRDRHTRCSLTPRGRRRSSAARSAAMWTTAPRASHARGGAVHAMPLLPVLDTTTATGSTLTLLDTEAAALLDPHDRIGAWLRYVQS